MKSKVIVSDAQAAATSCRSAVTLRLLALNTAYIDHGSPITTKSSRALPLSCSLVRGGRQHACVLLTRP